MNQWLQITGDSKIVDIRRIDASDDATRYVTKYLTKPADQTLIDRPDKLADVIKSLKGKRFVFAFGSLKSSLTKPSPDKIDWIPVGPLSELIYRSKHGDEFSRGVLRALLDRIDNNNLKMEEHTECLSTYDP